VSSLSNRYRFASGFLPSFMSFLNFRCGISIEPAVSTPGNGKYLDELIGLASLV